MIDSKKVNDLRLDVFESAISFKKLLVIVFSGRDIEVYPHCLNYLDGGLCLIAEDCSQRSLQFFKIEQIYVNKKISEHEYKPNFSTSEISDFIFAMRAVIGCEERLVLKFLDKEDLLPSPPYQVLGNPYITVNQMGQKIWGASIEKSEVLVNWLVALGDKIEILEPESIKREVLTKFFDNKI